MGNKFLVVDDSELLHNMYELILRKYRSQDGTIEHALNGQEALEKLQLNDDFDLIILDINMPVMNGLELLELLKEKEEYRHIPVLLVTTEGKQEDVVRGLGLGASGYLTKPFKSDSLHELINRILTMQANALQSMGA